jgi:hypothetical protein
VWIEFSIALYLAAPIIVNVAKSFGATGCVQEKICS